MLKPQLLKYALPLVFLLVLRCGPEVPVSPDGNGTDGRLELHDPLINYHASLGQIHLQVGVTDGDLPEKPDVYSEVFRPDRDSAWFSLRLYDEGENGDQIAGDGFYGITLDSALSDTISGDLIALFWAMGGDDAISDTLLASTSLRANLSPSLLYIEAPDTIIRPDPGLKDTLIVEAGATDPDGLKDIVAVFFDVRDSEDTTMWNSSPFFVLNDAGIGADRISGDGIFATSLIISSENKLTDNIFRYYAIDQAGNNSPYIRDTITVYKNYIPRILSYFLSSPSQIVRPASPSGSDSLLFYVQVEDDNGLDELTGVRLRRRNPDGTTLEQVQPQGYDDGLHEDFSAGDGWFTIKSGFSPGDELGAYTYRALVEDAHGNRVLSADSIEVTLVNE